MTSYRRLSLSPLEPSTRRPPGRAEVLALVLILAAHLVIGTVYSIVVPLWEAYDEWGHVPVVAYVARYGHMPPTGVQLAEENDESHQPPLYYLLAGWVSSVVTVDQDLVPVKNPFGYPGNGGVGGLNRVVHAANEDKALGGAVMAFRLARWVNVVLSAVLVWLVYLSTRVIVPNRSDVPIAAAAICAFLPSFLFVGGIVNNDMLAALMGTAAVWSAAHLLRDGLKLRWLAGSAAFMVLGALSKRSMLCILPFAVGVTLAAGWKSSASWRRGRPGVSLALLVLLAASAFGAERLATQAAGIRYWERLLVAVIQGVRPSHLDIVPSALRECFETFVARFGWGNVFPSEWVYRVAAAIGIVALVGVLWRWVRDRQRGAVGWLLAGVASAVGINAAIVTVTGDVIRLQGRYVMVAIAPAVILIALGIDQLTPRRVKPWPLVVVSTLVLAIGALSPVLYIRPAYATPRVEVVDAALPVGVTPRDTVFDNGMILLGASVSPGRLAPGETAFVTLTWTCRSVIEGNYTLALKALGPQGEDWGNVHSYPGNGSLATSLWKPGTRFTDRYPLRLDANAVGQRVVSIQLCVIRLLPEGYEGGRR